MPHNYHPGGWRRYAALGAAAAALALAATGHAGRAALNAVQLAAEIAIGLGILAVLGLGTWIVIRIRRELAALRNARRIIPGEALDYPAITPQPPGNLAEQPRRAVTATRWERQP